MVYFLSRAKWGLEGGRGEEEKRGNQMNASPLCRQKAIICDCKIEWYPNKYHLNNTNIFKTKMTIMAKKHNSSTDCVDG